MQGAVINVITRQGSDRFLYDASYYGQPAGADQPAGASRVRGAVGQTERLRAGRYRDLTTNLGGPDRSRSAVVLRRLPVSARLRQSARNRSGVSEYLRAEQDLREAHLAAGARAGSCCRAFTTSSGSTPNVRRREAVRSHRRARSATVPAIDLRPPDAHVVGQHRVGCARRAFRLRAGQPAEHRQSDDGRAGSIASTGITSGAPPQRSAADARFASTAKATLSHYQPGLFGADHQWKIGVQIERGEHQSPSLIPTGVRFVDNNGQPFQSISGDAIQHRRDRFVTAAAFASDAITLSDRRDDQRRAPLRSQPRHQSGPAGARSAGTRNRRRSSAAWERSTPGTSFRRGSASPRNSPLTAGRCCARAMDDSVRAC